MQIQLPRGGATYYDDRAWHGGERSPAGAFRRGGLGEQTHHHDLLLLEGFHRVLQNRCADKSVAAQG
jgi:hypothetical protein